MHEDTTPTPVPPIAPPPPPPAKAVPLRSAPVSSAEATHVNIATQDPYVDFARGLTQVLGDRPHTAIPVERSIAMPDCPAVDTFIAELADAGHDPYPHNDVARLAHYNLRRHVRMLERQRDLESRNATAALKRERARHEREDTLRERLAEADRKVAHAQRFVDVERAELNERIESYQERARFLEGKIASERRAFAKIMSVIVLAAIIAIIAGMFSSGSLIEPSTTTLNGAVHADATPESIEAELQAERDAGLMPPAEGGSK